MKHYRKGLILSRRGRHIEAVTEYQKALKIDPDMAEVHYELGRSYAGLQYHDRAVRALDAARTLDPEFTLEALFQIAEIYAVSGRPSLAEEMCSKTLETDPDNIDIIAFLGRLKWEEEKANEARSWFEKVLTIDPNHVESHSVLAEIAVREGQYDVAEAHLKKITTEIDPTDMAAQLALAKVYRFSNRADKAIETLQQILHGNPDYVTARGALAEAYFSANRLDDARKEAEAFLKASPANTQAHFLLGAILLKQSDYESAVFHLTRAATSPSASAQTHYLLGLALKGTNKPAQAISAFQKALTTEPENISCRLSLAQTLLIEGSFEKAQREISHVLSQDPENEYARQLWIQANVFRQAFEHIDLLLEAEGVSENIADSIKRGLKAFRAGDLRRAQALCEDSIESAPDSPLPLNLLGLVYLKENELEQALTYFRRASNVDPEFAASYVNMANIYIAIGSHEQAVQTYRKAVELSPKDQVVQLGFAKALASMKHYEEAERFLNKLIQKDPDGTDNRWALANLLIYTNRYSDARKELAQILKLDPKHVNAAHLLAESSAKEGELTTAAASYETLLRAYPASRHFRVKLALCNLALDLPQEAREVLPAHSEMGEGNSSGEVARALIMQEQRQYDEAEKILDGLQPDEKGETAYELMLANIRVLAGNPKLAIDSFGQNLRSSEAFRKSYLQLLRGSSLGATEMYDLNLGLALSLVRWHLLGIERLEKVMRKAGPNAALLEIVGGLWEKEGQPDKASLSYQSALAADPSYWPAHYRLGLQSLRVGQTKEAEQHFRSALKHQPNSVAILSALGRVYGALGNDTQALATYRKINELHPSLAPVLNNLAWLLAKNADTLDRALEYARSAVAAQPLRAEARDTLGWIYFQKGDYESAKEQLDKAVLFNSLNPSIRYHRGMVYLKLDDKAKALEDFKKAGSTPSPFPERELNENMLRELS